MPIDCDYRVNKKRILEEYIRKKALNDIIKRFAKEIDKKEGLRGNSKTAKSCRRNGTVKGIGAMMERWFLIQELNGVSYSVFELYAGKYY